MAAESTSGAQPPRQRGAWPTLLALGGLAALLAVAAFAAARDADGSGSGFSAAADGDPSGLVLGLDISGAVLAVVAGVLLLAGAIGFGISSADPR